MDGPHGLALVGDVDAQQLAALRAAGGFALKAVCTSAPGPLPDGVMRTPDFGELLSRDDICLFLILTPGAEDKVRAAADAGKRFCAVPPLADSMEALAELDDRRDGGRWTIDHPWLHRRRPRLMLQRLHAGDVGALVHVRCRALDPALGIHLVCAAFGETPRAVGATPATGGAAWVLLDFGGGRTGLVTPTGADRSDASPVGALQAFGSAGTLRCDDRESVLSGRVDGEALRRLDVDDPADALAVVARHALRDLDDGEPGPWPLGFGLGVSEAIVGARHALETGGRVPLRWRGERAR